MKQLDQSKFSEERRKLFYRPDEAAGALGIKRTFLYSLMLSGKIRSLKLGRARLISMDALEEFARTLESDSEVNHAHAQK